MLPGKLPGNRHGPVVIQNINGKRSCPWFNPASTDDAGCPTKEDLLGAVKMPGKRGRKVPEHHPRLDGRRSEDDTPTKSDGAVNRRQIAEAQFAPDCYRQLAKGERRWEGVS